MKYRKTALIICLSMVLFAVSAQAKSMRSAIKDANQLYQQEQYDEALQQYMDIQVEHPGEPILDYNIGNTLYQQGRFDEAIEHYEKTALNGDQQLTAQAHYNIGNSLYQKALQTESTGKLDESINQMKEAVESYKYALQKNPDDTDIKYNIEFVQQEIKRLLDKIKEQQQQQQGQQKQQQQQGEKQDQQQQQGQQQQQQGEKQDTQDQQQQQGAQQQQAQQENDGEKQEGKDFKATEDKEDQQEQQGGRQKEAQELSEQEAARLLETLPDADKRRQQQQPRKGYLGEVEKNW